MYDYGLSTLEQYGLVPKSTARARGAMLCYTEKGLLILREFRGSERKLKKQQELLQTLRENGLLVDCYLENQEGNLVSRDKDDIPYTLQYWYEGKECDTKQKEDILEGVHAMARLHKAMRLAPDEAYVQKSLREEYTRHNAEIRKIRKFIRKKGPTNQFEKDFLSSAQWFLERGEAALQMLENTSYETLRARAVAEGCVCHGEYNQHNVLILKEGTAVTNFAHWTFDVQMADLYCFMRKVLEKYNWNLDLARAMLRAYHQYKPITDAEMQNLKVRFTYPEKYWKLANYYFSHNKAWISEKNIEKLQSFIRQKELWGEFAEKCFGR